jgi:predicted nuclease of predicted toxin-antitoxin system
MRFLVDANLPRSTLPVLQRHGHFAEHARDIGLGASPDPQIAQYVRANHCALVTRDLRFADIREYPPADHFGILVMRLPDVAVAEQIVTVLDRFLKQPDLVQQLPGRLAILEPGRVRFRPAIAL